MEIFVEEGVHSLPVVLHCRPREPVALIWISQESDVASQVAQPRPDQVRLIVGGRVASGYRPYGLPHWFALSTGRLGQRIMERSSSTNAHVVWLASAADLRLLQSG
jgi:hypothetical protein